MAPIPQPYPYPIHPWSGTSPTLGFASTLARRSASFDGHWRDGTSIEGFIIESWSEGFMVGALVIMECITVAAMRKGVLLHKLILFEQLLATGHGTFCFMAFPGYDWYLSSTAALLYCSYFMHNVVSWVKVRPFFVGNRPFFAPKTGKIVQRVYLGTLALTIPVLIYEIFNNFRFFNNINDMYRSVRPYEPLMRDPWWLSTNAVLLYIISKTYNAKIFHLVSRSPRLGILLAAICLAISFTIVDIVASITDKLSTVDGINPYWKLSLVFKSLTDAIMLDDFQTELNRLGAARVERDESERKKSMAAGVVVASLNPFTKRGRKNTDSYGAGSSSSDGRPEGNGSLYEIEDKANLEKSGKQKSIAAAWPLKRMSKGGKRSSMNAATKRDPPNDIRTADADNIRTTSIGWNDNDQMNDLHLDMSNPSGFTSTNNNKDRRRTSSSSRNKEQSNKTTRKISNLPPLPSSSNQSMLRPEPGEVDRRKGSTAAIMEFLKDDPQDNDSDRISDISPTTSRVPGPPPQSISDRRRSVQPAMAAPTAAEYNATRRASELDPVGDQEGGPKRKSKKPSSLYSIPSSLSSYDSDDGRDLEDVREDEQQQGRELDLYRDRYEEQDSKESPEETGSDSYFDSKPRRSSEPPDGHRDPGPAPTLASPGPKPDPSLQSHFIRTGRMSPDPPEPAAESEHAAELPHMTPVPQGPLDPETESSSKRAAGGKRPTPTPRPEPGDVTRRQDSSRAIMAFLSDAPDDQHDDTSREAQAQRSGRASEQKEQVTPRSDPASPSSGSGSSPPSSAPAQRTQPPSNSTRPPKPQANPQTPLQPSSHTHTQTRQPQSPSNQDRRRTSTAPTAAEYESMLDSDGRRTSSELDGAAGAGGGPTKRNRRKPSSLYSIPSSLGSLDDGRYEEM